MHPLHVTSWDSPDTMLLRQHQCQQVLDQFLWIMCVAVDQKPDSLPVCIIPLMIAVIMRMLVLLAEHDFAVMVLFA
jgi:hypothetical protein